jgi:hypothetical protein
VAARSIAEKPIVDRQTKRKLDPVKPSAPPDRNHERMRRGDMPRDTKELLATSNPFKDLPKIEKFQVP